MKEYLRYFITICFCAVLIVEITNHILPIQQYFIDENVNESQSFREMDISAKALSNIDKLCRSNDLEKNKVIASLFLANDFEILSDNKKQISMRKYKKYYNGYNKYSKNEYQQFLQSIKAIFNDIKYFPVAIDRDFKEAIAFDDSFGAERNYKGTYGHEGTDIMAKNNTSGYYPIVSSTDGKIENIGWLEKGGYRVGVRSPSGGYFYYAHLSSYSDIKKGDNIKAGTVLGYMGDTGYSTVEGTTGMFDVHLHFGIYIKTKNYIELSVNPYHILEYLKKSIISY